MFGFGFPTLACKPGRHAYEIGYATKVAAVVGLSQGVSGSELLDFIKQQVS